MTTYRNITAISAAAALVTLGSFALAQDDLDDLLSDLETSETKAAEAAKPEATAPAAEVAAPAVEEVAEVAVPAVEEPKAEVAEVAAPAVEEVKEEVAEVAAPAVEEPKAEVAEVAAPAVEEPKAEVAEVAAPAVEEPKAEVAEVAAPAAEAPKAEESDADLTMEIAAAPAAPAGESVASAEPVAEAEADDAALGLSDDDRELLANIRQTEEIRRNSYDTVAKDAIREARAAMLAQDYASAARLYGNAAKLLNDSPTLKPFAKECAEGEAMAFYRFGLAEWELGRHESAMKQMKKAIEKRNPLAKAQLDAWMHADDPDANATDYSDITHRQNEKDYVEQRAKMTRHLKRARQLLSVRDLDKALEECEMVLRKEAYNEEALRLRRQIIKKQSEVLSDEFETTRDGMIAEVDKKWRPVYAPNMRDVDEVASATVKKDPQLDPERALEQTIVKRMKEMRLPTIQFKPPATIIDAVEFFRTASKDFDDPATPIEKRGFNFVLKSSETLRTQAATAVEDSNDFGAAAEEPASNGPAGVPVIPMITASDITFYEALKLVCDSVDYKFKVQGPIVMVMPKNMTVDEMVTRSYPVMAAFFEKMDNVSSDMKELRSGGFGGSNRQRDDEEGENKERDWKDVFSQLGVQWPEGSSIFYMKATGKLRVKNTYENLAELEKALIELNAEQKLVEIEARFVEVQQEDLNSLGFEWILNSDYTIGGGWLANKLGLGKAGFTEGWTKSSKTTVQDVTIPGGSGGAAGSTTYSQATVNETTLSGTGKQIWSQYDMNGRRIQKGIAGINSFGGADATYAPNNRYLSTVGNQIATQMKAEGNAINDQFMRVNAFLGSADLSMILHMLSQRTDTDLLSAPKVLTRPGEEAVIKVVTEYIYPTDYDVQLQSSSSSSGGGYGGGSSSAILAVVEPQSFTMREVGVILDVTPTLTDDGNLIDLKLNTQVVDEPEWKNYGMKIPFTGNSNTSSANPLDYISGIVGAATQLGVEMTDSLKTLLFNDIVTTSLDSMRNSSSTITYYDAPMEQPFFHVRSIDSSVSIYPGATIVMGGLITETRKAMDDKVPFLGDLPFVGRLFRSHSELTSKKNLLIFVTTRLVDVRGREVVLNGNEVKDAEVTAAPEIGE